MELLTALVIPVEIAIFSIIGSINERYSHIAAVISSIVMIGYIIKDLSRKDHKICFYEECIDIANQYKTKMNNMQMKKF